MLANRLPIDRRRDFPEPVVELSSGLRPVIQETPSLSLLVHESMLVKIAVDRLENGHAPSELVDGNTLRRCELE